MVIVSAWLNCIFLTLHKCSYLQFWVYPNLFWTLSLYVCSSLDKKYVYKWLHCTQICKHCTNCTQTSMGPRSIEHVKFETPKILHLFANFQIVEYRHLIFICQECEPQHTWGIGIVCDHSKVWASVYSRLYQQWDHVSTNSQYWEHHNVLFFNEFSSLSFKISEKLCNDIVS